MHAIDRETGKQKWRYSAHGRIDSSPVVVGRKVIFGSMDELYQIDISTGKVITRYEIGASISVPVLCRMAGFSLDVRMETYMRLAQENLSND